MWGQSCVVLCFSSSSQQLAYSHRKKVGVKKFQAEVWPGWCGRKLKGQRIQGGAQRTQGGYREPRQGCPENEGVREAGKAVRNLEGRSGSAWERRHSEFTEGSSGFSPGGDSH